jgi:adenosylcobalamin-dependent ribonucleoside-triphosphate reductase
MSNVQTINTMGIGNILPFEAQVAQKVANNEYATIDLRKVRNVLVKAPFKLDDDFIAEFVGKEPGWGELGWFTFKRTYARRVERADGTSIRTEEWTEVVRRVVEGNLNILADDPVVTQEYGQKLYRLIWNLVFTPPGRGLWISGTPFAERTGDAFNNCWFVETRPWHYGESNQIFKNWEIDPNEKLPSYPFVFLFDQSMKGGGVGFSAEEDVVAEIPMVRNKVNLYFRLREDHPDFEEVKAKAIELGASFNTGVVVPRGHYMMIGDEREGWAESYGVTIDEHFRHEKTVDIEFDLSDIRESGKPIKGFGGTASGSAPLLELLWYANKKLNERVGGYIDSVLATDLHNHAGRCTVAGNVRRTAEVALGSNKDKKFTNMKNYLLVGHVVKEWVENEKTKKFEPVLKTVEELMVEGYSFEQASEDYETAWAQNNHRWASNNSIVIDDPRNYDFGFIAPAIEANGEPGIFNRFLAQNFGRIIDGYKAKTDKARGGNPCMEIPLESGEPCNLVEYHLPVAHRLGIKHEEVIPFMVHLTKRVTFTKYDWEQSAQVINRNRRIGVSLSGVMDWVLLKFGKGAITGWKVYDIDEWHDQLWKDQDVKPVDIVRGNTPPSEEKLADLYVFMNDLHIKKGHRENRRRKYLVRKLAKEGYQDKYRLEPMYNQELLQEIDYMYKLVIQSDIEYSALLTQALGYQVNPSVRDTTNKPSGTVALLSGISPGIHSHYFRYGKRRIRVQSNDPLLKLVELAGYYTEPASQNPGSHVIEFPFKAPTADYADFRSADEVTIEEQFALQSLMCVYWADNMVSCTITFHEDEKPKIKHQLEQYRMRIKSTSLLPYSGHGYIQAPYEPTSKETWEAMNKKIHMKPHDLYNLLMASGDFEDNEMSLAEMVECQGGHCPTR